MYMKKNLFILLTVSIAFLASCGKKNPQTNYAGAVTDICGNTYNYVKIGEQYWMAENMRCNKYDTQSDRNGAELSTSIKSTNEPYYTDASDNSNWASSQFSGDLSNEQVANLGYLYNWAAAVGIATKEEAEAQEKEFSSNRQGICPNGWHVSTNADWAILVDYLEPYAAAGYKLKSTSGWYNGGNGSDVYSFAALPVEKAEGSTVYGVGLKAYFWTASPQSGHSAYNRTLGYEGSLICYDYKPKSFAFSVRCVKN